MIVPVPGMWWGFQDEVTRTESTFLPQAPASVTVQFPWNDLHLPAARRGGGPPRAHQARVHGGVLR